MRWWRNAALLVAAIWLLLIADGVVFLLAQLGVLK